MTQYHFVTVWKYEAPVEKIWPILRDAEKWPSWWKGVRKVETLQPGDENGVGSVQRYTWRSQLPYNLVFDMRVVRVVPFKEIEGDASGELVGKGLWYLSREGSITRMQYNWDIATTKPWMNTLEPIARPFFAWNHDAVMRWGGKGLAKLLGTPLIE
jgi:Polyketide cyclase / dehydrase and lipid transport